jgi:hypothetical protein
VNKREIYRLGIISLAHVPVLHTHFSPILIFLPGKMSIYSVFPPEKWVYTQFSPRKNEYILRFPPRKNEYILNFPPGNPSIC